MHILSSFVSRRRCRAVVPCWHLTFLLLFLCLLLFCVRQRLLLKWPDSDDKLSNQTDKESRPQQNDYYSIFKRLRRRLTPSKLELFDNPFSGRDYVGSNHFSNLQRIAEEQYSRNGTRKNQQTIGMRYVDTFLPGEVNLTELDRDTLKRLQMMEIVDAMVKSGGELVEKQIEEVIRRHAQLNKVTTESETRLELQTNAWDVCLGEQHTLCNGHLSSVAGPFWHCVCAVSPFRHSSASSAPPLCSSALLVRNVSSKVLTVPLLFPLPALFSFQSLLPQLMDSFLAHWLSITFRGQLKFVRENPSVEDQMLLLRKECLDDHFFVVQFAFLKKSAREWGGDGRAANGQVRDDDLLDIQKKHFRSFRRALWAGQTVLEVAYVDEVSDLLPEKMLETEFFRKKVANLNDASQCSPPWDYKSFVFCHPRHFLFFSVASVFVLGVPAGAFRFYHQIMTTDERQRRRGRRRSGRTERGEKEEEEEEEEEESTCEG